jgi:hypothetical protein
LTDAPSLSTIKPGSGGYLGNLGLGLSIASYDPVFDVGGRALAAALGIAATALGLERLPP